MFAKQIWKFRWVSLLLLLSTVSWVVLVPWYGKCCCCCAPNANVIEFESKLVSNTCGIMQRMFTILYYIASSLLLFLRARQRRCWKRRKEEKLETFSHFFLFCRRHDAHTRHTHRHDIHIHDKVEFTYARGGAQGCFTPSPNSAILNCNVIKLYPFWVSLPGNKIRNFSFSYFISFPSLKIDILNSRNSEFSYIFDNVEFFQWNSSWSVGTSVECRRPARGGCRQTLSQVWGWHRICTVARKKITKLVSPAGSILIDAHHRPSTWKDIDDI